MNKAIPVVFLTLFMSCSEPRIDYAYTTELVYMNNTEHTIVMDIQWPIIAWNSLSLSPGATEKIFYSPAEGARVMEAPTKAVIVFDGEYKVCQQIGDNAGVHSLCDIDSYIVEEKQYDIILKYVFTEDDYNNAVSSAE